MPLNVNFNFFNFNLVIVMINIFRRHLKTDSCLVFHNFLAASLASYKHIFFHISDDINIFLIITC